jgi:hypothetical protein
MVKRLLLITLLFSSFSFSQTFELGFGAKGNFNWLKGNEEFLTGTFDSYGDTVYFNFNRTKMDFSYSIPIFLRFRTNFGFWTELSFATETMRATISGTSNYSQNYLQFYTEQEMIDDYNNQSNNLQTIYPTYNDFYNNEFGSYYNRESDYWEEKVSYREITQYNNVTVNFGYTFLRTKKIRPFALLGFEWNSRANKNHYQELNYKTFWVTDYSTIYRKLPRLNSHLFFLNIGAGIEMHNLQLGMHLKQSLGYAQEYEFKDEIDEEANPYSDLYKNITSFSFYLKYSLFNFNVRSSADRKKLKDDELKVLGDFKEKSKICRISLGVSVPFYTNINSFYDQTYNPDTIYQSANNPNMVMDENVVISNFREESGIVSGGNFETRNTATHIGLGRIKRINQFPKLDFVLEIEPVKYFSYEASIGYQYAEYDTEAKVLHFGYDWQDQEDIETLESTVLRQNINTISIGQKLNVKYDVTPELFIGINGGVMFNFFIPGKYKFQNPGYNNDPLFEEFDKYYVRGDSSKNWNNTIDGAGDPSNSYYFRSYNPDSQLLEDIGRDEVMTPQQGRFWMSWTAGIDFYYDRLKVSPYVGGKIIDMNFLYRDFFNVGIGFFFYLRK